MTRDELVPLLLAHRHLLAGLDGKRAVLYCSCGQRVCDPTGDPHGADAEAHAGHVADVILERMPPDMSLF